MPRRRAGDLNPHAAYAVLAEIPAVFARGLAQAVAGSAEARESALECERFERCRTPANRWSPGSCAGRRFKSSNRSPRERYGRGSRKGGPSLLRAGQPQEAAKEFEESLRRHEERARSLLGLGRSGNSGAYRRFLEQWSGADESLPELEQTPRLRGSGEPTAGPTPSLALCPRAP